MSPAVPLIAAFAVVLLWAEHRWPLRQRRESTPRRLGRNLVMAGLSAATVRLCELPLVLPLAQLVDNRGWGLLGWLALPSWAALPLALLLLDYTLYVWHVLNHRIAWLWRFHAVHHLDLDMDASTALRFHAGEILLSVPWRAAQVVLIGVDPAILALWQAALFVEILFHHSNLRLPSRLDRALSYLIVTPRLHGIHHSIIEAETNSNWSSGLTVWDRLHHTLRTDVLEAPIDIGVPAYRSASQLRLWAILLLPFRRPAVWQLPDGSVPRR